MPVKVLIRTLWQVPLMSVLIGFHCTDHFQTFLRSLPSLSMYTICLPIESHQYNQGPVVKKVNNAAIGFPYTYFLDSNSSGGLRYPTAVWTTGARLIGLVATNLRNDQRSLPDFVLWLINSLGRRFAFSIWVTPNLRSLGHSKETPVFSFSCIISHHSSPIHFFKH